MRIISMAEMYGGELTELRSLSAIAAAEEDEEKGFGRKGFRQSINGYELEDNAKTVCVTSGLTFVGRVIVKRLLLLGYSVRVIVDSPDDGSRVREMRDETAAFHGEMEAVTAKLTEVGSLVEAFDGCNGVFHTSGFIDSSGVSTYYLQIRLLKYLYRLKVHMIPEYGEITILTNHILDLPHKSPIFLRD
ncbi:PREDICTED: cinnamoyl-CoA reductase-like SNL6 [Tarenaya hassleriana]|uniref:cinnamoyl-CoA reductase-like SNL6 n=1 Tax=Tarenaya hassleriana TaxID=28532 RepID=UPI00053CA434|nr:PREDICTED: cinnamoyl-CoA reductase-like SNL6 [Tarenaya hassleriana]